MKVLSKLDDISAAPACLWMEDYGAPRGTWATKKESLVSGAHQLQTFPVVMKCIACARDALQKALKHRIV